MSLRYQDVVLKDFSGGISDNYVNMPLNRCEIGDNIFILEDRSFEERYGSTPVYDREINTKINYMADLDGDIYCVRDSLIWYFDETGGVLTQPARPQTGAPVWPNTSGFNAIAVDDWQDQLIVTHSGSENTNDLNRPMRIYKDQTGSRRVEQLGLKGLSEIQLESIVFRRGSVSGPSFEYYEPDRDLPPPPNASSFNFTYVYAFIYSYEYQTERSSYRVVSPVEITSILYTNSPITNDPLSQSTNISNLPTFELSGTQSNITNIKLEIYRTVSGGSDLFKVQEVPVTSITGPSFNVADILTDEQLVTREPIYTSGNVLDRFQAPLAKYVKIVNDTAYWGYVADETSGDVKPFRVIQGFSGIVDSHDPAAFVDVDDEVRGIGEVSGFPIVFTASEIYRLEGSFDNTGGGSVRARTISETAGCASHNGIVRANDALYWIGDNAVYATNGYKVQKIPSSVDLLETVRNFTRTEERRRTIQGVYDEDNERIIWAVNESDSDNSRWLVLNLNTGGFTTASSVPSSAILFSKDYLYRSDEIGYIYKHGPEFTSDPVVEVTQPIANWYDTHVDWLYKSVAIDFGDPAMTNWVSHFSPYIESDTNYGFHVGVDCDDGRVEALCKEIRSWGNFIWGEPDLVWGDDDIIWSKQQTIRHKRHTPKTTSRAKSRQIIMKPANVLIYKSDVLGLVNNTAVDPTSPFGVYVDLASGDDWPSDIIGYSLSFENDGYAQKYLIQEASGSRITLLGSAPLGNGVKWQISGKPKKSQVSVKALTIRVANIDNEGNEFTSGEGNEQV